MVLTGSKKLIKKPCDNYFFPLLLLFKNVYTGITCKIELNIYSSQNIQLRLIH